MSKKRSREDEEIIDNADGLEMNGNDELNRSNSKRRKSEENATVNNSDNVAVSKDLKDSEETVEQKTEETGPEDRKEPAEISSEPQQENVDEQEKEEDSTTQPVFGSETAFGSFTTYRKDSQYKSNGTSSDLTFNKQESTKTESGSIFGNSEGGASGSIFGSGFRFGSTVFGNSKDEAEKKAGVSVMQERHITLWWSASNWVLLI